MKSAHQCKSVCKRWFSLISGPYFAHKYILFREPTYSLVFQYIRSPNSRSSVIEVASTGPPFNSHGHFCFSFLEEFDRFALEGSCNGLVLLSATYKNRELYIVSNPFTRQWVSLPEPPQYKPVYVGFVCKYYNIAEGLFSNFTQYKVVLIQASDVFEVSTDEFKINIFSSLGGDWSEISVHGASGFVWSCSRPLIACKNMLVGYISDGFYTIGESEGRIRAFSRRLFSLPLSLCVWELEDFSNSAIWSLKHKINLSISDLISKVPSIFAEDMILGELVSVMAFCPIDGDVAYLWFRRCLLSCNIKTKTVEAVFLPKEKEETCYAADRCLPFFLPSWPTSIPGIKSEESCS
ncbi:unnamed protein product [Dovyalis caffra]|uniref:F-box protein At3g26010-like beta-propeller domain-containing protein n=1 Tax=Dovyalis caffra TaxID=77055 RepID=A0AAV1SDR4_9ROSI|nr:unnamed protein product [Dovyalis caffra]